MLVAAGDILTDQSGYGFASGQQFFDRFGNEHVHHCRADRGRGCGHFAVESLEGENGIAIRNMAVDGQVTDLAEFLAGGMA